MYDWLTLKRDVKTEEYDRISEYLSTRPHIVKWTPATGEIEWSQPVRESIRSDSHQVTIHVTHNTITISGSPARSMGYDCNVFGSSDLQECINSHLTTANAVLPFKLGRPEDFRITRLDITENYDMGGKAEVRQSLAYLRQFDGGRYRVQSKSETVYWGSGSSLRSGKAYAKGDHLRYENRKGALHSDQRIQLADRLLRLELKLGNKWFSRKRQEEVNILEYDYQAEFNDYFSKLIGTLEVKEMNLKEKLVEVSPTEGQALAAYRTWALIQSIGHMEARESMPKATWYRHAKMLRDAGIGWGDMAAGKVLPFKTRQLVLDKPVTSWDELQKAS
jgi:II/X family phage/plasmid replication protein